MWILCLAFVLMLRVLVRTGPIAQRRRSGLASWRPNVVQRGAAGPANDAAVHLVTGLLGQHEGPMTVDTFLRLVRQEWARLEVGRPLSELELDVLSRRAGFGYGLHPAQQPLPRDALLAFSHWYAQQLDVVDAARPLFRSQIASGFESGRAQAVEALRKHGPGTFCLRLGSVEGHLVLSLAEEGSDPTELRINHYLFSADRLRMSGLARLLDEVPGCSRLLDLGTGQLLRRSQVRRLLGDPSVKSTT